MRRPLPAALAVLASICAASVPTSATVVEHVAGPVGDVSSRLVEKVIGPSLWQEHALPATTFQLRDAASSLTPAGGASSFRLQDVPSEMRPRTEALLTEFGAREEGGRIVVSLPGDVLFDFDKSNVRADARPVLDRLVEILSAFPSAPVAIEGHTDSKGSDDYNLALSERRAESIMAYLADKGISADRLEPEGYGETRPVAANEKPDGSDDPAGRQRNRRVEFVIGQPED